MAAVGDPRGYYRALGVDRTASAEDIRTAFRLRAKELHPDRAGETGDREAFRRLREAYEALRDPQQRLRYDTDSLAEDRGHDSTAKTSSAGVETVWRLLEQLAGLPLLPVAAALLVAVCLALAGWLVAAHRGGALVAAESEIAGLKQELADTARSELAPPLLEVELRFPRGTAELDAAMLRRLEAATAALQRQIAALPADSRWQVAVDGLIDRAADQRGLLVDAWERTLLRIGVTAQYLVGHGIPADRVAVRFQAGDIARPVPARGEAIVLSLTCCAEPAAATP